MVRMSTPDLRLGKVGKSSDKRSTAGRVEHSTSPGLNTGRPLAVISAAGRKAPAMVDITVIETSAKNPAGLLSTEGKN